MTDPGPAASSLLLFAHDQLLLTVASLFVLVAAFTALYIRNRRQRLASLDLASNLSHYRMLFDSNPNPMYVYDVQTLALLAVNETLLARYGYPAGELLGQPVLVLHVETDREDLRKLIASLAVSQERQFKRRWFHLQRNGSAFPVEIFSQPVIYSGQAARLVVVRDIADQVRAEDEVLSQRHFRETLLEALPMPVFYKDREGRYLGMNEAFLTMFEKDRAHFVGKSAWDIAPPELAARYQEADDALYATPDRIQVYSAKIHSDASGILDVVFTKAVFRDGRGEIGGLIGTVLDVTERNASERALRESQAELSQILENSPLPIFVIDAEHRVVVWNPACERTFGPLATEMIGTRRQWAAFYPSERPVMADIVLEGGRELDVERYYTGRYRRSVFNPEAFEAEDFFPNMGAGGRWLFFTASPLRDSSGKVVGAIETLLDITERKKAEQQAQELNERLEARVTQRTADLGKANEELRLAMKQLVQTEKLAALGSLVAGVAHELNTPLGNVLTVATALHARTEEFSAKVASGEGLKRSMLADFTAGCLDAASIVERNAQRASNLIGSFKEVAVDQTSTRRRSFDLAVVIDEMMAALQPTLRRTTHSVSVEVPDGIVFDSYPGPLEQVLSNLILNSLLHGFESTVQGRIVISAASNGERVTVHYRDDGCGMHASIAQQAFDPFFTTKLGKGGSGLGLYIVYNLTTAVLGGDISLHSEPDKGVEFTLVLPIVAPRLAEHDDNPPSASEVAGGFP